MAGAGSVSWLFEKKGYIVVSKAAITEDKLMSVALDAGAEDMSSSDDSYEIKTSSQDFEKVKKALTDAKIKLESSEITMLPKNSVNVSDAGTAKQILDLVEILEDHDDVQHVYANFDIPDEILKESMG